MISELNEHCDSSFKCLRAFVHQILKNPHAYKWSIQGFGMLRLHVYDSVRLNIWLKKYRVPDVSLVHTHPWSFRSTIISGCLMNYRYYQSLDYDHLVGRLYSCATIKPGPGGGLLEQQDQIRLVRQPFEMYRLGDTYSQACDEIHMSDPYDGCVTLNYRVRIGDDVAKVYWPINTTWVSAEPRNATPDEIQDFIDAALREWPVNSLS